MESQEAAGRSREDRTRFRDQRDNQLGSFMEHWKVKSEVEEGQREVEG